MPLHIAITGRAENVQIGQREERQHLVQHGRRVERHMVVHIESRMQISATHPAAPAARLQSLINVCQQIAWGIFQQAERAMYRRTLLALPKGVSKHRAQAVLELAHWRRAIATLGFDGLSSLECFCIFRCPISRPPSTSELTKALSFARFSTGLQARRWVPVLGKASHLGGSHFRSSFRRVLHPGHAYDLPIAVGTRQGAELSAVLCAPRRFVRQALEGRAAGRAPHCCCLSRHRVAQPITNTQDLRLAA